MRPGEFSAMCATILIVVLFICGAVWVFNNSAKQDERDAQHARIVANRANHACGKQRPVEIHFHGSGWSNGAYWIVRCKDDSVRIVQ